MTLKAWIVDDDESIRWVLQRALSSAGIDVSSFPGGAECLDALEEDVPDVLLTDVRMKGMSGLALLERVHKLAPDLPTIVMTAHSDLDSAVAAYKGGAFEYLPKPFDLDDAVELVRRAARSRDDVAAPQDDQLAAGAEIIGEAPAMQDVFRAIGRLSKSQINVLITGESGTGKELIARALHAHSPRARNSFIAINTAAIPKELMESEFFGHERGAFTGATTQRQGRFEQADGGTLFLDEIGEMPADLQTRLLRVLADGQFYRVGGHVPVKVNVRVIAATNQDLERAVAEERFREDLFHRLNVIRIRVPPLRERREDIPLLLRHFMSRCAGELGTDVKVLKPDVVQRLAQLEWPGNVRQLENVCRWLTVMAPGAEVHVEDLPSDLMPSTPTAAPDALPVPAATNWEAGVRQWGLAALARGENDLIPRATAALESALLTAALEHTEGRKQEAAQRLGWGRNTLTRKLKELGLG